MENRVAQFRTVLRRKDGNFWGKPPDWIKNVWVFCELMVKKHRNIIIAWYFMCEIYELKYWLLKCNQKNAHCAHDPAAGAGETGG